MAHPNPYHLTVLLGKVPGIWAPLKNLRSPGETYPTVELLLGLRLPPVKRKERFDKKRISQNCYPCRRYRAIPLNPSSWFLLYDIPLGFVQPYLPQIVVTNPLEKHSHADRARFSRIQVPQRSPPSTLLSAPVFLLLTLGLRVPAERCSPAPNSPLPLDCHFRGRPTNQCFDSPTRRIKNILLSLTLVTLG